MTTGPRYINPWSQFVGCFLPNWLLERPELTLGAKVTYARLAQFAGRKGVAIVRRSALATKLASSERSVGTYLTELIDAGLIEGSRPGLGQPNQYRFLDHAWLKFRDERDDEDIPDRQDLPIRTGKVRRSAAADVADHSNVKNQKKETGASAPDDGSDDPSLFQAPGLPDGSPGSHGSPSPHGGAPPPPGASQNGHGGKKAELAKTGQRVHEAWQEAVDSPRAKFTDARRSKVNARLREGYTEEQLITVVTDGWRADPWPGRVDNNDLVILLRDGPQVEKFLKLARKAKATTNGNGNGHHADPGDAEAEVRAAREFNARQAARQAAAITTDRGVQLAAELAAKGAHQ
jgi:hypothetical protein